MATKKSGFDAGGVLGAVVAVLAVYLGWKFLSSAMTANAATATGMTGNSSSLAASNPLTALIAALTGKSSATGSAAKSSMPGGSGSTASYSPTAQSSAQVSQTAAAISNLNASALSTPNFQDLGGQSLASYVPVEPSDSTMTTIAAQPGQLQTLSNLPSYSMPAEPTTESANLDETIPSESLYEQDLASEVAIDQSAYQSLQEADNSGAAGDGVTWGDDGY